MNSVRNGETPPRRFSAFLERYGGLFWWLHSVWALLIGAGMMWLGSRHYGLLRVTVLGRCEVKVEPATSPTGDITRPVPF